MAFSNQLGKSGSKLGNIVLGASAPSEFFSKTINQSLTFTEIIDYDFLSSTPVSFNQRCNDDILQLTETISYSIGKVYSRAIFDALSLYQPCITSEITHLPRLISRTINQSLTLTDRVSALSRFGVSQSLSLIDTINYTFGNALSESINQTLTFTETVLTPSTADQSFTDTLTLTDDIEYTFREVNVIAISDDISFDEVIVDIKSHFQTIVDSLIFTESNLIYKIYKTRIKDTLALTDTLDAPVSFNHTITDQLIFKNNYDYPLNYIKTITIPTVSYNHISASSITPDLNPRHRKKKYLYMSATNGLIELPSPLFDDSYALTNQINVAQSMNGKVYSFVKKSKTRKLTLNFSLTRFKVQELGTFYLKCCDEQITLTNYNGDRYIGYITSEPLSYSENRAYDNQVELTFEGLGV